MPTNLINYLESMLNPQGCFKSLDGIFVRRGQNNAPLFTASENTVKFEVEWKGENYRLICFLNDSLLLRNRVRMIIAHPAVQQCPYLAPSRYIDREMLVFNEIGVGSYRDVVLQQTDNGAKLDDVLLKCSTNGDAETPRKLLRSLYELSCGMFERGIAHNNIRLINIRVINGESLRLINFERIRILSEEDTGQSTEPYAIDNLALANLAVVLYIASCDPQLYVQLRQSILHRLHDLRKILPKLCQRVEETDHKPLLELANAIRYNNGKLKGRQKLNLLIKGLIDYGPLQDSQLHEILLAPLTKIKNPEKGLAFKQISPEKSTTFSDFPDYDWKSGIYDTLVRVEHQGKYFYTDRHGTRVTDQEYDFAYDFFEGRAVVVIGDNYALIDREGNPIIPFICEDLEWDPVTGIAKVMIDGKWGIFDRCGQPLTPMKFDWMGSSGDGLIVARIEERYGYLRKDGSEAIPFQFDDAFSFEQGKALVEVNGEQFWIDSQGKRL